MHAKLTIDAKDLSMKLDAMSSSIKSLSNRGHTDETKKDKLASCCKNLAKVKLTVCIVKEMPR